MSYSTKILLFLFHILLGFVCLNPLLSKVYGIAIILVGSIMIIYNKNRNEEALLFAGYLVAAEVLLRMTQGAILHETGKYGVALFLIIGLTQTVRSFRPNVLFIFYLLLILLGIVFTVVPEGASLRKSIVFNLSGPILLGIAGFYCYQRRMNSSEVLNIIYVMVLPIISMCTFLYFRTPTLKEVVFTGAANFSTSGGFGPNQVATSIGLGIACLSVLLLLKKSVSGFLIVDALLLAYFIYRGLLTFSRGGIISAGIVVFMFAILYAFHDANRIKKLVPYIGVSIVILIGVWLYTSNITGGALINRYTGKDVTGRVKEDASSGRVAIFEEQLKSFVENPVFGIGVGNGKYKRLETEETTAASHNEIGRLIEEHGLIGVSSLFLLVFLPLYRFTFSKNFNRAFLVFFAMFWFLTINHSAMRIALPSLMYGLALLNMQKHE